MTVQPADLYEQLKKLRYELTACQGMLSSGFAILKDLDLPEQPVAACPSCGVETRGPQTLAEHLYNSHGGPLPEHWARADALAEEHAA